MNKLYYVNIIEFDIEKVNKLLTNDEVVFLVFNKMHMCYSTIKT